MSPGVKRIGECLTDRRLALILMPTEACNFRCVYCYESFQLKRMKPSVVTGIKRLLSRRASGLRFLTLSWFGGEPLLAAGVIEEVMTHARFLADSQPGLELASDITTNAFLLDWAMARRLLDLGVREYQISFDGPREWHDRKRVLAGGRGTFDRIWGNVIALKTLDDPFRVTVRLHVDRENVAAIPEFLDLFASEFGADPRFDLFIRALGRFGGPNDPNLPVFERDESRTALAALREQAAARRIRLAAANGGDPICYAAMGNSFLIRSDGRLGKCTLALDHPTNDVGRIREDGTLEIRQDRIRPWLRGLSSADPAELACPMKGLADRPEAQQASGGVIALNVSPAAAMAAASGGSS